jgi:hypothetical protein
MLSLLVRSALILFSVALLCASPSHAESISCSEAMEPVNLSSPCPSFDTANYSYVLNDDAYAIPRHYIWHVLIGENGAVHSISMKARLPSFDGMTRGTADCFLNYQSGCRDEVILFSIATQFRPRSAEGIRNPRWFMHPERKVGPCGLEYFEDRMGLPFNYFEKQLAGNTDVSMLRCWDERRSRGGLCSSEERLGKETSVRFSFYPTRICEWDPIKSGLLQLISHFKR